MAPLVLLVPVAPDDVKPGDVPGAAPLDARGSEERLEVEPFEMGRWLVDEDDDEVESGGVGAVGLVAPCFEGLVERLEEEW
jgi:hypothetical protein